MSYLSTTKSTEAKLFGRAGHLLWKRVTFLENTARDLGKRDNRHKIMCFDERAVVMYSNSRFLEASYNFVAFASKDHSTLS